MKVDLHEDGLLWLINRVCFHPRGFALGHVPGSNGDLRLYGDGTEPWRFATAEEIDDPTKAIDEDALFRSVERTFARARRENAR